MPVLVYHIIFFLQIGNKSVDLEFIVLNQLLKYNQIACYHFEITPSCGSNILITPLINCSNKDIIEIIKGLHGSTWNRIHIFHSGPMLRQADRAPPW